MRSTLCPKSIIPCPICAEFIICTVTIRKMSNIDYHPSPALLLVVSIFKFFTIFPKTLASWMIEARPSHRRLFMDNLSQEMARVARPIPSASCKL